MDKMDQGLRDLLAEVMRLIDKAVKERMESEEFQRGFDEINRRMSDQYGRIIGAIALNLEFMTIPVPGGGGERKKASLSLNLKFGGSREDEEMGKLLGLGEEDFDEMNRALERARKERVGGEDVTLAGAEAVSRPPAETEEAAEFADPRSISQIVNSIREIARTLNLEQRRLLVENLGEKWVKRQGIAITEEQMKNGTAWLQSVQNLINEIQSCRGPEGLPKKMLLVLLEGLFKKVSAE